MQSVVENEIENLIKEVNEDDYYQNDDNHKSIYKRIGKIKDMIEDYYNVFDIWYDSGCEFPFKTIINIKGKEQTIEFDSVREMLSTIRLLK